jgi:hypothetical protein
MSSKQYSIEIDRVTASQWSALLDDFADANIYQTWAYGAVRWGEENLSHVVLKRGDQPVAISQLRIVKFPFIRGGIAYLRWGPLWQLRGQEMDAEIAGQMVQALHQEYAINRGLFLRILPDAFAGSKRAEVLHMAFSNAAGGRGNGLSTDERTFLLDLKPGLDELRKKLDQKWRNQLNRAEKNGLTVDESDSVEALDLFLEIYYAMMARKQFSTSVDAQEFRRMQADLPAHHRMKVLICRQGETPVAGIVCSIMGNSAIYLLGATNDNGLTAKGGYLLQWTFIKRLKEAGIRHYDLGGIDPLRNPGVYHFKSGLSGADVSRIAMLESCANPGSQLFVKAANCAMWCKDVARRTANRSAGHLTRLRRPNSARS